jgi:hypothetical protein
MARELGNFGNTEPGMSAIIVLFFSSVNVNPQMEQPTKRCKFPARNEAKWKRL